jgi:RNA polymerase sigma-70 factor (ECF subfamily)
VGELYAAHHRRLIGYLRCTIPDADAEAAVQETFYRALLHYDELRELGNPWAWLVVVARNLARNQLRDAHIGELVGLAVPESALGTVAGPEERACVADDVRRIGAAIATLTALQRRMLSMLLVDGLSSAEAGRRLGLREDAARQHLCRLRRRLVAAYESGSKGLAAIPLLGLRLLKRALRRFGGGAAPSAIASGAVAAGALIGTLGVVAGIIGAAPLTRPQVRMTPHAVALDAATTSDVPPMFRHRTDPSSAANRHAEAHLRDTPRASTWNTSASAAGGKLHAEARVSKHPTHSGDTLHVDVSYDTPAGTVDVPVDDVQYGSALGPACGIWSGACDG